MEELWNAIRPEVLSFVVTVFGLVATWAINSLRRKLDSQRALSVLNQLERVADIVTMELEQKVVPVAKEALADGKLTAEEADKIKALAVERAKAYLPKDVPIDAIASAIEAAVFRLKQ